MVGGAFSGSFEVVVVPLLSRDGASSDGMVRRKGSDEGGDGKADADVGVIFGSGQRCGKGRGKKSCRLERQFSILPQ